jgi:hypothetical protein
MKKIWFKVMLSCLLMAGCATGPQDKGVVRGMTQDQVLEIMGEPSSKRKNGYCVEGKACNETWSYYGRQVVFVNGVVQGF